MTQKVTFEAYVWGRAEGFVRTLEPQHGTLPRFESIMIQLAETIVSTNVEVDGSEQATIGKDEIFLVRLTDPDAVFQVHIIDVRETRQVVKAVLTRDVSPHAARYRDKYDHVQVTLVRLGKACWRVTEIEGGDAR